MFFRAASKVSIWPKEKNDFMIGSSFGWTNEPNKYQNKSRLATGEFSM